MNLLNLNTKLHCERNEVERGNLFFYLADCFGRSSLAMTMLVFSFSVFLIGCKVNYSFTGASISPDIKTITIKTFPNYAPLAPPIISQRFSESLRDVFTTQSNLNFVGADGDVIVEGTITAYNTSPTAVQGNQQAALNRLTMRVHVKLTNNKDEKGSFEQDFEKFSDFPFDATLSSVEETLMKDINNQLAQEIFNKAFINW